MDRGQCRNTNLTRRFYLISSSPISFWVTLGFALDFFYSNLLMQESRIYFEFALLHGTTQSADRGNWATQLSELSTKGEREQIGLAYSQ